MRAYEECRSARIESRGRLVLALSSSDLIAVLILSYDAATCSQESCSLTSPLWLCLICGSLGCGRKQFGGAAGGGEGHGVEHYATTGHAIAVKMGTIEMGGTGGGFDSFCFPLLGHAVTLTDDESENGTMA